MKKRKILIIQYTQKASIWEDLKEIISKEGVRVRVRLCHQKKKKNKPKTAADALSTTDPPEPPKSTAAEDLLNAQTFLEKIFEYKRDVFDNLGKNNFKFKSLKEAIKSYNEDTLIQDANEKLVGFGEKTIKIFLNAVKELEDERSINDLLLNVNQDQKVYIVVEIKKILKENWGEINEGSLLSTLGNIPLDDKNEKLLL